MCGATFITYTPGRFRFTRALCLGPAQMNAYQFGQLIGQLLAQPETAEAAEQQQQQQQPQQATVS